MAYYTYRQLTYNELMWARTVFDNSLPHNDVYLADRFLPGNENVPVTCVTEPQS